MNKIVSLNQIRVLTTLVYVFVSTTIGNAQDTLSFHECVEQAFQNNLRVRQQRNTERMYKLNVKRSQDAFLPAVSGSLSGNGNWGRGIDPSTNTFVNQQFNNYSGSLNSDLLLFQGFNRIENVKLQKKDLDRNKSEVQRIYNDIMIDLSLRYTNILYFTELIDQIKSQIAISQDNIKQTEKRIEAGALAKREIYRVQAQKDNEELSLIQAKNNLDLNKVELNILLNKDMTKDITIKSLSKNLIQGKTIEGREAWIAELLNTMPNLEIAKVDYEKAKIRLAMAKSGFYPTITAGANIFTAYSTNNRFFNFSEQLDNNRSMGLSLSANIPIFNRHQTRNNVTEAQINIQNASIQKEIEKQAAYRTLWNAYNNAMASQKKYEVSQSALKSNQMNYEADKIRLDAGRINLQELNISKGNYFSSMINLIRDKYEMIYNNLVLDIYEGKDLSIAK